jgi:imidazolonepropionase-like amidohydrolase
VGFYNSYRCCRPNPKSQFNREENVKTTIGILLSLCLLISACASPTLIATSTPGSSFSQAELVLTNGTLIDGTGNEPIPEAILVIGNGRILAAGTASQVIIPEGVKVVDLSEAYILPGFINAHVHDAFDGSRLKAWAQAGVTTVRDEGIFSSTSQLSTLISLRDELAASNQYARLVSAGYMFTVPGGYGSLKVTSAEDAQEQVKLELDAGVDMIKLAMEDGYGGSTNLALLTPEELKAVVSTAHMSGVPVSAHITEARYLQQVVDAGVDDAAHIPWDEISPKLVQQMIDHNIYAVSTLTVMDAYGAIQGASKNLGILQSAGVQIAMGNDYTRIPQNGFDHFELGMPMHELNLMKEAGLTPMQIIVAATRNAAHVCDLEEELGTLEQGKLADILILVANPLQDLSALTQVKMVIHNGEIIRQ